MDFGCWKEKEFCKGLILKFPKMIRPSENPFSDDLIIQIRRT
ncbi:hypothetical protein NEISUBOT_05278 [Neisseria subflava NJ9703]|uniref:Uncharacterized protein n=1 Tax=Neisseria subflava NJ9703 TaxID=546268 RepID=A0A9W5MYJ2_NEISU|nr:hypothetical protein NEISUBOT_05278 [Neisseria subflava NJ9703]